MELTLDYGGIKVLRELNRNWAGIEGIQEKELN